MRWRTKPIELLLLAFFAVFLLYPLACVFPGSASDEDYAVRLLSFGNQPQEVLPILLKARPEAPPVEKVALPLTVATFPPARKKAADELALKLTEAGARADVVRERHW